MTAITETKKLQQPPVFKLSFLTAMFERAGFYVLSFLIVLYAKEVYQVSDTIAFTLFAVFSALAYLMTAAGGYLADNVLGIRRCIILGLLLEGIGLCMLYIPSKVIFPIALACIILGVGMFKTGPTHLLGRSYGDKDPRIDSGFTLYYMGMNIGSFTSAMCIGEVQKYFGWRVAFLVGGVTILLGLVWYFVFRKSAYEPDSAAGKKPLPWKTIGWVTLGLVLVGLAAMFLVSHEIVAYWVFGIATALLLVYFIFEILRSSKEDKPKIIACLILILMGFVFFVLYQQAYTSVLLFINRCVVRTIMGFEIPAVAFFALNSAWVIILGPILAWTYTRFGKKNKDLAVTTKFPIGLLVTSLTFFALVASSYFANANYQVSPLWAVLAYFFYTLGEMLVSALGVAMVTHIAPKRMYGIMMGTWFVVGMALSAALSGVFASRASIPDTLHDPAAILAIYNHAFLEIGVAALVVTALAFAIGPYVKRIAKL